MGRQWVWVIASMLAAGCGESRSKGGLPYFPGTPGGEEAGDDGAGTGGGGDTGDGDGSGDGGDDASADDGGAGPAADDGDDGAGDDGAADDAGDDAPMDDGGDDAPMDDGPLDDGGDDGPAPIPGADCSADALALIDMLNDYRAGYGLPAIAASSSMCVVGDTHAQDLANNSPSAPASCNLHSWSNAGVWSGCCYTADHAQAQCMWDKPGELTVYPGTGYENAAGGGSGPLTPAEALSLWQNSSGHNAVMLNEGVWADHPWQSVGAGFHGSYAVLWFGEEVDPADQ